MIDNNNNNNNNNNNKLPESFYKYVGKGQKKLRRKIDIKDAQTKFFRAKWIGMVARCYREWSPEYKYYGARGIKIVKEWHDVVKFIRWCDKTYPKDGRTYSIDRVNVNGNYSPTNCRWATAKEQARNRRTNVLYKGKTLSEWAEQLGCRETTINGRLHVMHWSLEKAVTTPIRRYRQRK